MNSILLYSEINHRVRQETYCRTYDDMQRINAKVKSLSDALKRHADREIKSSTMLKYANKLLVPKFPDLMLRLTRLVDHTPDRPKVYKPISVTATRQFASLLSADEKVGLGRLGTDLFVMHVAPFLSGAAAGRLASTCKCMRAVIGTERLVDARERFEIPRVTPRSTTLLLPTLEEQPLLLQMLCRRTRIMGVQYAGSNYMLIDNESSEATIVHTWQQATVVPGKHFYTLFEGLIDPRVNNEEDEHLLSDLDVRIWVRHIWHNGQRLNLELSAYGAYVPIRMEARKEHVMWRFSMVGHRAENWTPTV